MAQPMRWYPLNPHHAIKANKATSFGSVPSPLDTNPTIELESTAMPRGLAYGDGFFTTMGVYQGHALWQSYHAARLQNHSQALHLYLPKTLEDSLWQQVASFASQIEHGLIKIIVSRQAQSLRGYSHAPELTANQALIWIGVLRSAVPSAALANRDVYLTGSKLTSNVRAESDTAASTVTHTATTDKLLQQSPISAMCLTSRLASMPPPLAGLKTLNRLDSVLIAGELERHKQVMLKPASPASPALAEGLVRDISGSWVEGVMSNVFYQLQGANATGATWFTPPIIHSGVNGIMRQVIMDKLANSATPVQLRALHDNDLRQISALFFCNAVRGVIPVRELWLDAATCIKLAIVIDSDAD